MMSAATPDAAFLRDLGGGLIMRRSRAEDRERIAAFHATTLLGPDETPPLERIRYWLLDALGGAHPTIRPDAFVFVEDTATGRIVSSVGLFATTWTYEGIPMPVGQVDVVSTDPAYRRRGLVAQQFAEVHAWSAQRGDLMQVIPGIPWYYRQFGYEFAVNLEGGRVATRADVPPSSLTLGEAEPFVFRPLAERDLPFVQTLYEAATRRSPLAVPRDEAFWRFDVFGRHDQSGLASRHVVFAAATAPEQPVGVVIFARRLWGTRLGVRLLEVAPGTPLVDVAPAVLRYLDAAGQRVAADIGKPCDGIEFELGEGHPLYDALPDALSRVVKPYAWYVRAPNLPRFLNTVAPALEARLAASPQAGYSGELALSSYRSGVKLTLAGGRITVSAYTPERVEDGDAFFPDLTFLKLLMGYRTLADLEYAYPDCSVESPAARALLPVLFPQRPSHVWDPT
ncbi:MAG: GNAT family N-acetyltransferase [Thermomicrobiales bacterium]